MRSGRHGPPGTSPLWRSSPAAAVSSLDVTPTSGGRNVAFVTLGCARNDVDSEELAARLAGAGWNIVDEPDEADAVVVKTSGFVEAAKRDYNYILLEEHETGSTIGADS